MSRLLASLLISIVAIAPAVAQISIPGFGNKSSTAAPADLPGAQDQLVNLYAAAGKNVLTGNAKMADAVGLKDKAAAARAAGDALGDGATKGALNDADKATSDTNAAIAEKLKNTDKMDAPAKQQYAAGIVSLAQGLVKYTAMKGSFTSFQKSLSSASPMLLPKLQTGAYIVSSFPSSLTNLSSALSNAVAFAKTHDIPVPKDATDALGNM